MSAEPPTDGTTGAGSPPQAQTPEVQTPEARLDRRKQILAGLLTLAVLVFVFVGVFPKFANYSDAWDSIQSMSVASVTLLVAVAVLNVIVYVFPYQAALPGLPFGRAFVVRQTSFMISNAIPAGGAFGLGVQYTMLSGYGYGAAATSSAIAATSLWNLLVTLALPALGVAAIVFVGGADTNEVVGAVVGLAAIVVLVGLFMAVLRSESVASRLGAIGDRLAAPIMRRFDKSRREPVEVDTQGTVPGGQVTRALLNFRDNLRDVVEDRWGLLTVTSTAQQFCQFLILAVAFYGIAGSSGGINPVQLFAAFAIARLAGFIPITPGGLGTVDAAMVALMVQMGAQDSTALAATLVWRAASFIPQVVLGIVTFLVWRRGAGSAKGKTAPAASAH